MAKRQVKQQQKVHTGIQAVGAISYLCGLVGYVLVLALLAVWLFDILGIDGSSSVSPGTGTGSSSMTTDDAGILAMALGLVVIFAAFGAVIWATIRVPVFISRFVSRCTHAFARLVAPKYDGWTLFTLKSLLYVLPAAALLGVYTSYTNDLTLALLACGALAAVVATVLAAAQTSIANWAGCKAKDIL